ncbi:TetR family transcriptional regulator [Serinibacter arcticus]|uniref:TetR family transcriptional regulator n=1 Tax=Serinibacter arcticus TaxID=1655435 RepID=A0A2U1ZXL9_9MICO|nr:TetR/AcrR family transcriptional regulator [Serinibacter arcticus]PWD51729.1 TetR family transcriptional regulator [Serinibacter arcticus]
MSRVVEDASPRSDGRSLRWESHRAARRDDLTRAARKAIHHGGPDLSMDEIASAIGTSKSIVYRYFRDRSGLQTAVGEAVLQEMGSALADVSHRATGPRDAVRAMVGVYLGMISTSPAVYTFVTRGGEVSEEPGPLRTLADDAAALLVPVLSDALAAQERSRDAAHMWAAGVIGFVRGAAEVWLVERGTVADRDPDVEHAEIERLADTLAGWICVGTPSP